ncbi:MAG: hypothetical protein J6J13_03280 [Clostridia bacterium]|nr:hypothetical protein [Clostridia bacterium]
MRLPKMPKRQAQALAIPDLAGGLNLRDGMSEILDNQLTESKNMWFSDGVLKTRPSLFMRASADGRLYCVDWSDVSRDFKQHDVIKVESGTTYTLCSSKVRYVRTNDASNYSIETVITFWWVSDVTTAYDSQLAITDEVDSYFTVQKGEDIYLFASNRIIYRRGKIEFGEGVDETTSTETIMSWTPVSAEEIYIPIVYAHCKTEGSLLKLDNGNITFKEFYFSGTQFEGFNTLSNRYKAIFSTVNQQLFNDEVTKIPMKYPLPKPTENCVGETIVATITHPDGTKVEHTATILSNGHAQESGFNKEDDLMLCATSHQIWFEKKYDEEYNVVETLTTEDYIEDNLEIIAPYIPDGFEESKDKIFKMSHACWFGGASNGLAGGNRLFLCGNTNKGEESLVCWSGLDKPLYFPENSYFYVGNTASAVTGFGKQSDKLVIFKENETWLTQYYQNTSITAEDLINQSVIDYASSSVYFPLMLINPNIGCPYPDTIQLCRNRLVWAGSDGNVYTLVSENQYNERSIYSVSEMIQSRLREESFDRASACDWNGYYCLCFPDCIYLMDYNNYGYTHIASHSKTEDANLRIPWYYWEMSSGFYRDVRSYTVISDKFIAIDYRFGGRTEPDGINLCVFEESGAEKIESTVTTKLFAFSAPHYRKNIDRIDLQLGNNGGEAITVEIITDCGSEEHIVEMQSPQTDERQAGFIENRSVFPTMRQISRVAVKLSCNDHLIIDGMIFKYRITGGVR